MPKRIPFARSPCIGTDIVKIDRIRDLVWNKNIPTPQGKRIPRFLERILHPLERLDFDARFPNLINNLAVQNNIRFRHRNSTATWLAGRWAAKEAAKKAWGATKLGFKDVRVEICAGGEVQIVCHGKMVSQNGETEEAEQVGRLSISHDGDYAIATVLVTPLEILLLDDVGNDLSPKPTREKFDLPPDLPPIRKVNLNFDKVGRYETTLRHEYKNHREGSSAVSSEVDSPNQPDKIRDLQRQSPTKGLEGRLDALNEEPR